MARLLIGLLILLSLGTPRTSIQAQAERPWEVVLFSQADDAIYIVNEQGLVETIPTNIASELDANNSYKFRLSPNHELFAYAEYKSSSFMHILNLKTNATVSITSPYENSFESLWMGD